ncbi:helix-turn-helix domain-containing protein [uncultured Desulfovibrio sp.]|uniref:helix-turn-helix domain-containing protein n=1 Tax=uncultured Desulfovibrio sp. TaxID=167968 RepID=UPI00261A5B02|nr:helix-turn-helix domain-containing protein [uncultured Desulfovibrio sp.]
MAAALKQLNLFRGTFTGYGEGYDLELAPTRLQALIMVENGYSVSDICRKLGRCRSTICRLFRKEGVDYSQKKGR